MPEPMVTLGDELCSGYGTRPEATPRMTNGSISACVLSGVRDGLTRNDLPHWRHSSSTSPSSPMFAHLTSLREIGRWHSLHFSGTSYGYIETNESSSSSASIHSTRPFLTRSLHFRRPA